MVRAKPQPGASPIGLAGLGGNVDGHARILTTFSHRKGLLKYSWIRSILLAMVFSKSFPSNLT